MTSEPPGPRDHLLTHELERRLAGLDSDLRSEEPLDPAEGPERLARHAMKQIQRDLAGTESAENQAEQLNGLLADLGEDATDALLELPPRVLTGIKARSPLGDPVPLPPLPATPLGQSDLLTNAEGQPNIGSELRAELASAESVDLICAFIIWSGVRQLRDALADVVARGGRIRVVTTTYMGATEKGAVDALVALGADPLIGASGSEPGAHSKTRPTKNPASAGLFDRGAEI